MAVCVENETELAWPVCVHDEYFEACQMLVQSAVIWFATFATTEISWHTQSYCDWVITDKSPLQWAGRGYGRISQCANDIMQRRFNWVSAKHSTHSAQNANSRAGSSTCNNINKNIIVYCTATVSNRLIDIEFCTVFGNGNKNDESKIQAEVVMIFCFLAVCQM